MITLEINPFFQKYLPALDWGQEQQLKKRLTEDLTTESILYWYNPETEQNEILDGHHRYKIAQELKLEMEVHEKHFHTMKEAELFIIRTQTTRRNIDNWRREQLVKQAVDLLIEVEGKTKTEAVQTVAAETGFSERTIWEDVKPLNPVEKFKQAKAELERNLTREKTKAVEKFKVQALKEGLDEDEAQNKWSEIEETIDKTFADEIAELETLADHAQQAMEDNPSLKNTGPRTTKKSTKAKAARRNTFKKAISLMDKLTNDVFYFWDQNGCTDVSLDAIKRAMRDFGEQIAVAQVQDIKDAKKKRK